MTTQIKFVLYICHCCSEYTERICCGLRGNKMHLYNVHKKLVTFTGISECNNTTRRKL